MSYTYHSGQMNETAALNKMHVGYSFPKSSSLHTSRDSNIAYTDLASKVAYLQFTPSKGDCNILEVHVVHNYEMLCSAPPF